MPGKTIGLLIVASRPITTLKAKQAPGKKVENVVHEELCYTTKELNDEQSGESVWEWTLRVWDNGGRNVMLDQAEFIDICPLSGDSRFDMEACTVKKRYQKVVIVWLKHLLKDGLMKRGWRCLVSLGLVLMKAFLRFREISVLE